MGGRRVDRMLGWVIEYIYEFMFGCIRYVWMEGYVGEWID